MGLLFFWRIFQAFGALYQAVPFCAASRLILG